MGMQTSRQSVDRRGSFVRIIVDITVSKYVLTLESYSRYKCLYAARGFYGVVKSPARTLGRKHDGSALSGLYSSGIQLCGAGGIRFFYS
jgi:hypothetical protein